MAEGARTWNGSEQQHQRKESTFHLRVPDGSILSERAQQKVRGVERGLRYCIRQLIRFGAIAPRSLSPDALAAWLRRWKARLCRSVPQHGNHKYAWALHRNVRLPRNLPYAKQIDI